MRELRTAFEHVFRDLWPPMASLRMMNSYSTVCGRILSAIINVALIRSSRARSNHNDLRLTDIALVAFAIVLISALLIAFVSLH